MPLENFCFLLLFWHGCIDGWKLEEERKGRERLKTVEKPNYFHVLGKCFLAAEESSIYNRVQVLREVIGGSRVNLWQMLLSPRLFFFLIQLRRLHLHWFLLWEAAYCLWPLLQSNGGWNVWLQFWQQKSKNKSQLLMGIRCFSSLTEVVKWKQKRTNRSKDSEECNICWFLSVLTWATSDQQTENPYLKATKWLLNGICLCQKSQGQMFVLCWMGCQTNDQNRSFWPQTFLSIQILHFSSKTGWMDVYILWETAKPAG